MKTWRIFYFRTNVSQRVRAYRPDGRVPKNWKGRHVCTVSAATRYDAVVLATRVGWRSICGWKVDEVLENEPCRT